MQRADPGALLLAALAGASVWVSLGTLAVGAGRQTTIGALPSPWILLAGVVAAAAVAWVVRLRTAEAWPLTLTVLLWLPWVPARVPPALLLWEGPLEAVVWGAAIAGVVVARTHAALTAAGRRLFGSPRAALVIGAVFCAGSIGAGVALRDWLPGGDEPHYLVITQSLLHDGDLQIENNHLQGDTHDYYSAPLKPDYLRRGTNGAIYSIHAPGVSALVLPAFALAGYPGAMVFMALLGGVAVAVMGLAAGLAASRPSWGWIGTLAVAGSATFFLHSFTIFPDPAGAVAVAVALYVLVVLEVTPAAVTRRHLVTASACLALLPWLHTRFALLAGAFGLVIGLRLILPGRSFAFRPAIPAVLSFAALPAVSALAWFASFWIIYGTIDPAAPYGGSRQNAVDWMASGLAGLAFDQQFGLVTNAPVLALLPYGLLVLGRLRPRLALELALIAVPYVLVVASFAMWWGGWSAPARFLVPLMPLAAPVMAAAWRAGHTALRAMFVGLTLVGALNVWARVGLEGGALLYNSRDGYDLLLDWTSRTVNLPLAFPSAHRLGAEMTFLLAAIWLVAGGAALVLLVFVGRGRRSRPGPLWATTAALVLAAASAAMSASWQVARTQPLTEESSEVAFVDRWNPAWRPMALRWPPPRRVTLESALSRIELTSSVRLRTTEAEPPLLSLPRLPAGDYRVAIAGASRLAGTLTVTIGATSQPIEHWRLDGLRPGFTSFVLRLPTLVHSVTIRGDAEARGLIRRLALRPENVRPRRDEEQRDARRAVRYGQVRVFVLEDGTYVEPAGLWTRGDSEAELVMATDDGGTVTCDLRAGPVVTSVAITVGEQSHRLDLQPSERRRVELPGGLWRIETHGAFRPADHDAGNADARVLGVRLECP